MAGSLFLRVLSRCVGHGFGVTRILSVAYPVFEGGVAGREFLTMPTS